MTGIFWSPFIVFGPDTLTNQGMYIAKCDSAGNFIWAKDADALYCNSVGSSATTDILGNVYVAGYFDCPIITFGSDTLINSSNNDMFLVKYNQAGNVIYAKAAGGTSTNYANAVSADAFGNVYVGGYFDSSSIIFGQTSIPNTEYYGYSFDIFLAKLASTTGIPQISQPNNSILIYPNPANTILNIHLLNSQLSTLHSQLIIIDVLGNKVYAETLTGIDNSISIAMWSEGVYFYEIRGGNESARGKFIKQ